MKLRFWVIGFIILWGLNLNAYWEAYNIYRCGGKGLATGGAFTSIANDVSAIYWNPAGLIFTEKITAFYTFDAQLKIPHLLAPSLKVTFKTPALIGIVFPIKKPNISTLGFAVFTPFQRKTKDEYAMYFFSATGAYRVHPRVSVGANIGVAYTTYKGDFNYGGIGFRWQIGLLYFISRRVRAGLNYQFKTTVKWRGVYYGIWQRKETFPDILQTGVAIKIKKNIITSIEMEYQNWNSVEYIENYQNYSPSIETGLFKTIHPHIGFLISEYGSGALIRTGLYTDSYVTDEGKNKTQLVWTIGLNGYAFEIIRVEAAIADAYLMSFLNSSNEKIETIQITVEYQF